MYNITKRKLRRSAIFIETNGWVHGTDVDTPLRRFTLSRS
jgi:hypothetical protein